MNSTEHPHSIGDGHHSHGQTPYWWRAHRDWRFWFGLIAMLGSYRRLCWNERLIDGAFWPPEADADW